MYRLLKLGSRILLSNFKTLKEPYKLTFSVTDKCNSKCKICNIWKKKPVNELSYEEIKKIFGKINPSWVNITGGEPFLRNDLYEIAEIIQKRGVYLFNITTNGLLVDKTLDEIKKILNLNFPKVIVVVSLDGPKETHDEIRGMNGSWINSVNLFKQLKKLSKTRKNFQTYLGYTISKFNLHLIDKTLEDVKREVGVTMKDFHFNIFHTSSFYYNTHKQQILPEKDELLEDINYILKEKGSIGVLSLLERKYIKLIKEYLDTGKSPMKCKALVSSCFIASNGDVYPCITFNKKLGNIRESNYNLKKIWNSEISFSIRKMIEENRCDGCWTPCEAYQTILGNLM